GFIVALVLVFTGGIAAALFGDRGYLDVQRQRQHLLELQQATEEHQHRVEALRHEIERLKTDPFAVERIAREDLGYVAPGEIPLLLPREDDADSPAAGPSRLDAKAGSARVPAAPSTRCRGVEQPGSSLGS